MSKTTVWAIALAAVLAMAAVPLWSIAAWADEDESEDRGKKGKNTSEEKAKKSKDRSASLQAGSGNSTSLTGFRLMAEGLAVEKTEGNLKASDASIALVGVVKKGSGDQARATITGTVDIGSEQFKVRGEGKIDLKKGDFGKLNIEGKISKGGSDQKFQLKALVLQNGTEYKVVGEKPAQAGRNVRIYSLLGEMQVDRSAPAPVPAVASVVVTPAVANVTGNGNVTFTATATDTNGNTITGATFVWTLSNSTAGSLAPSATSAVFTGANVTASSQVRASLTHGGATVVGTATVNVSPAP